ncbi:MAG: MBL fold metallo-hydrolase, partial [Rhizobiales bacterium]|nr:MBL fold metallo-hydrolase [Hyphomicrobiales bacterium]
MPHFICTTCGTQYPESPQLPVSCPICEDERQYVPAGGQRWTTMAALAEGHEIGWTEEADGLFSLKIRPNFAIAQRAFLILHPDGNILWDCISLIDEATVRRI